METGKIAKEMIAFQKTLFESGYSSVGMILEQTEQMVRNFVNQVPWIPENGKKSFEDAIGMYKKSRDDFKKAVDEGFNKMEELFHVK